MGASAGKLLNKELRILFIGGWVPSGDAQRPREGQHLKFRKLLFSSS